MSLSVFGVIPARLASTRLPRKMLLAETGKPLLQHVWERVSQFSLFNKLIIATDSQEIATVAEAFGADVVLTAEHPSGTDRVAEVIRKLNEKPDLVVNVQGDEPELDHQHLESVISALKENPTAQMSTLSAPLHHWEQISAPSCVKVVSDLTGKALYFSRSVIPHPREESSQNLASLPDSPWRLHVGVYGYRSDFLLKLCQLPQTQLEMIEKLEQLRALEHGAHIQVAAVNHPSVGIDTAEDYARFVERFRSAQKTS